VCGSGALTRVTTELGRFELGVGGQRVAMGPEDRLRAIVMLRAVGQKLLRDFDTPTQMTHNFLRRSSSYS
jgi:hypothetical protein